MRTPLPVRRLPVRRAQELLGAAGVEVIQNRAVMKDGGPGSPLGIAGYLPVAQCKVRIAFGTQCFDGQCPAHPFHYPMQAISNILPAGVPLQREHDGIIQASWPEQHRTTSGTAPEDWYRCSLTSIQVDVPVRLARNAENHAFLRRFPEPDNTGTSGEKFFIVAEMIGGVRQFHIDER